MTKRFNRKDIITAVADKQGEDEELVEEILDAIFEEIFQHIQKGETVTLQNVGSFYSDKRGRSTAFKFNPSQRWRKAFGWTSSYKGKL